MGSKEREGLISQSEDRGTGTGSEKEKEKERERPSKWIQFGPVYGDVDTEINQHVKDSAWQHILEETRDANATQDYLRSIKVIQKEAMQCYDSSVFDGRQLHNQMFRWMMVKDGCFFLQLALHILGAGHLLGYPLHNFYFGEQSNSSSWIPAMFFVGNQIPCIVIQALMKQPFFQRIVERGKWPRPPKDDLAKLVLYQTVVEPQINIWPLKGRGRLAQPPPSNILHALHFLLLGSGDETNDPLYSEMRDFLDLETGGYDIKFPSARELCNSGIKLRKAETGISNIRFKNRGYSSYLYLPPFIIDTHTKDLLTSLVNHEKSLRESHRELTAYLRFMRDLTPTYKDFKILQSKGVIQVNDDEVKGTIIHVLHSLVSLHNSNFTLNFREIRRKIKEYETVPWRLISFIFSIICGILTFIIALLTLLQTIFTILSYYKTTPTPT